MSTTDRRVPSVEDPDLRVEIARLQAGETTFDDYDTAMRARLVEALLLRVRELRGVAPDATER